MSTLNVENIKHIAADSDSLRLATDGTVTFTKNVTAVTVDSATITNLSGTNVTADSATITNLSGTNVTADSATITNLSGTNVTASGDVKASSFNGGQLGGRRNLIINGAMQVAQRGTQETGITSYDYYTIDRMRFGSNPATFTMDQNTVTDLPGFTKSCKVTCTTAGSPTGTQNTNINYRLEGHDLQHLKKGTSDAESLTVSFWVKSGVTGTYTLELLDSNNSDRHVNSTYTVGAANTWEYKTITFAGDTTGAFTNDNNRSLTLLWYLSAGPGLKTGTLQTSWGAYVAGNRADSNQVNLASGNDSAVNYFEITGVQLELGDTATPFEHRSYAEELALCQRYYIQTPSNTAQKRMFNDGGSSRALCVSGDFPVTMRASPSMTVYGDIDDQAQTTLGAQGIAATTYGFSVFTSVYSGGFVDMHYYIAAAEL